MQVIIFKSDTCVLGLRTDALLGAFLTSELMYNQIPGVASYVLGISYHMGRVLPFINFNHLYHKKEFHYIPTKVLLYEYKEIALLFGVDEIVGIFDTRQEVLPSPFRLIDLESLFGESYASI